MFVNPANYWSILRGCFYRPWTVFRWRLVQLATGCGIHVQSRHPKLVARLRVLTEANVGSAFFKFFQNATQEVVIVKDLPEFQDCKSCNISWAHWRELCVISEIPRWSERSDAPPEFSGDPMHPTGVASAVYFSDCVQKHLVYAKACRSASRTLEAMFLF